jgi:hypothetical protein
MPLVQQVKLTSTFCHPFLHPLIPLQQRDVEEVTEKQEENKLFCCNYF